MHENDTAVRMANVVDAVMEIVRLGDDARERGQQQHANSVYQLAIDLLANGECAGVVPVAPFALGAGVEAFPASATFVAGPRRVTQ